MKNRSRYGLFIFTILLLLLIAAMGCSGGHDPIGGNIKNASSSAGMPTHPVLSNVLDITLDNQSALGIGYFYDLVKPSTDHVFKARFSSPMSWRWRSDDVNFTGRSEGSSDSSEIKFLAPGDENEISVWLILDPDSERETSMRWRINVKQNPVPLEFIHPDYEGVVKYGDPVAGKQADVVERELMVTFNDEITHETALRTIFNMECAVLTRIYETGIYRIVSFDNDLNMREKMDEFRSLDSVEYVGPNFIFYQEITPNDSLWSNKWDSRIIHGPEAWDVTTGDNTQVIAIIDSGIDRDHPDLGAKVLDGQDFISGGDGHGGETDGDGIDNNNDGVTDGNVGHGTHCAGIAAAISNNSIGTTGVSWETKLIPLRIFPIDGDSGASSSSIMGAYNWLYNNAQARNIIAANMSFGAFFGYSTQEQSLITSCYNRGVIMVAACGNSNWDADQHFPSAYDNVISVAATNSSDVKASFSDYGSTVDVSAPGVQITSTYYNNTYTQASGTSMACPEVTGLVGLVKAKWTTYSQDEIVDQIKLTADNIDSLNPGYAGLLGTGRINAFRAVSQGLTPTLEFRKININDSRIGPTEGNRDRLINSGETVEVSLNVGNTGLSSASNVDATLEVDDPQVHLIVDSAAVPTVPRAGSTWLDDPFFLFVERSVADGTSVNFKFTLDDEDGNGPWEFNIPVKIYKNNLVNESLATEGESVGPDVLMRGTHDVPLLRIDFTAPTNYVVVDDIRLTRIGTAPQGTENSVKIYLDSNGNDVYDGSDEEVQIGISSYENSTYFGDFDRLGQPYNAPFAQPIDSNFGTRKFDSGGHLLFRDLIIPVTEDHSASIFIVVDIDPDAVIGTTYGLGVSSSSDIDLKDGDVASGTFPINSDLRKIRPTWGDERQLTFRATAYTWRAQAAVDSLGYVHVVWDENKLSPDTDFDIGYRRSTNRGDSWGSERLIFNTDDKSFFPDIAITSNDTIHVMFYSTPNAQNNREVYYMRSFDSGVTFEIPLKITEATGESRMPRLYADGSVLHVAFHSNRDGSYDIYYMKSTDDGDTFSTPVQVNNSSLESEEACIVGRNGKIHITWQDVNKNAYGYITSGKAFYAYSPDDGLTFQAPIELSAGLGGTYKYGVKCDADSTGHVWTVFHSDASGFFDVYMREGTDGVMTPSQRITFMDSGTGWPCIHVNSEGTLNLVYDDTPPDAATNIYFMFKESTMTAWSNAVRISLNTTGDAQIPSMLEDTDFNIFCFWQDNREETQREEVWYNTLLY